jgi:hypothetical protein
MKVSHTKHAFLCFLSQLLYTAVLMLLLFLRMNWNIPLFSQIVALIGMGVAFLWPAVSLITDAASFVFSVLAWRKNESVAPNVLMMVLVVLVIALAFLLSQGVMGNLFYG